MTHRYGRSPLTSLSDDMRRVRAITAEIKENHLCPKCGGTQEVHPDVPCRAAQCISCGLYFPAPDWSASAGGALLSSVTGKQKL